MKQVLVTGGVRGIGLATAREFAKKGYAVAVCYSHDEEGAALAREEGFRVVKCDVSDEQQVKNMFDEIGNIDVLVNNAGVSLIKMLQDTTLTEWNRLFSINMTGAFLCSKYALEHAMIAKNYGAIVNVSSIWGEVGGSCEVAYSASKAALIGFTKALAKEVCASNVRVNCVTPGTIDTKMNEHFSEEDRELIHEDIPLGRMGRAEEVAQAICMLVENEYMTGVVLPVNGGMNI